MEEDLVARLRAYAALRGLVGSLKPGRPMIDWGTRPNSKSLPAIVMYQVSPGVSYDQENPTELEGPRVQFSIIAKSYGETALVFRRLRALLETKANQGATNFDKAFLIASRDLNPKDLPGGGREFLRSADFTIWHRRAAS